MRNAEIVNVQMSRLDLVDLMLACTGIEFNLVDSENSKKKWRQLHDMLEKQLRAFDAELDKKENRG